MTEATLPPLFLNSHARKIPGSMAIWAAILAEMSEFAIMFIVYFLARAHNPKIFIEGPTRLSTQGLATETNIFYAVYYYVTFNHFLHVGWGSVAIIWVIYRLNTGIYTQQEHEGLINVALYWHMIDLAWITIFPLLYVIR